MNLTTSYAYTLTIPRSLFDDWGFFEYRGYLPQLPGDLLTESEDSPEVSLGLSESEAWEFSQACDDLGQDLGACVADMSGIQDLIGSIV